MAEEINEPEDMFQSWDGKPIYAKKAERDVNGNPLALTIENEKVTAIGGVSVGGGGEPVDAYTKAETNELLEGKQDNLTFDGTYDATTNPVATVSTVESAIPSNLPAAKDGVDASLVTTGNKYDWDDWKSSNITIPLPKDTIEVNGHLFKYVQIGNLLVTTENLDIPLGTVGTNCFWYNDDEDTNRGLGMLYKFSALGSFQYIDYYHPDEFVPTQEVYDCIYAQGWRIWTNLDWDNIIQAHIPSGSGTQDGFKNMCASSGWTSGTQGSNTLGLNLPPSGERRWNGTAYTDKGAYFVARTIYTQKTVNKISPTTSLSSTGDLNTGASIRLVKDVTV
jgi:uncharacterized protein (TIGR02145 family)